MRYTAKQGMQFPDAETLPNLTVSLQTALNRIYTGRVVYGLYKTYTTFSMEENIMKFKKISAIMLAAAMM